MDQDKWRTRPARKTQGLIHRLSSMLRALAGTASEMLGQRSVSCVVGNFLIGDFFGDVRCRHGHPTRLFNIGRGHFVACDICRTFIFVGSNLMSSWREETEDLWRANSDSVEGYEWLK